MSKEKILKATHEGQLRLGENAPTLDCAVLEDGSRIISQNAIFKAFGRTRRGRPIGEIRVLNRPAFIDAKNLQPFIGGDLEGVLNQVEYIDKNGKNAIGYNALILPLLCKVYHDSRAAGVLKRNQEPLARVSEILLFSLSKIGIIALVDEATGYQHERERDELQKILKAYISEELLPWQRRFPDVFYKELFRLNGWDYTVKGIKKRPGVIGTWTNKLVYEQLPNGVLQELKNKTPRSASGNYTAKFFQSLTPDTGDPHLTAQIQQIITLFMLSDNMKDMWQKFEKLRVRQAQQLELPFEFDKQGHTVEPAEPVYKDGELSKFNKDLKKALDHNPNSEKEK
jgi:hypothetical protein